MTSKPTGKFRRNPRHDFDRDIVYDVLDLKKDDGTEQIRCEVFREALEDRAGTSAGDILSLYEKHQHEVHDAFDRRLKLGQREADGSIFVRTGELRPIA